MKIQLNFPEDKAYISNLAFIRALLIKGTIEKFEISYKEKERIFQEVLEYLRTT